METSLAPLRGDGRIPVTLLTGFLGTGKTTLIDRLTRRTDMAGTVLLINEFGEVGIDGHLLQSFSETTVMLESGCVCCSMNGDLVAALEGLHERMARREIPPIRRVIVETTGLADPVPVVTTLAESRRLNTRWICDGIVTVVDAARGAALIDRHPEARRQVAMADVLLLGKADLADRESRAAFAARLARLNPTARLVEMRHGDVDPVVLFGVGLYADGRRADGLAAWLGAAGPSDHSHGAGGCDHAHAGHHHHPHGAETDCPVCHGVSEPHGGAVEVHHGHAHAASVHGEAVTSFVVTLPEPVGWAGFAVAMGRVLADHGTHLLRAKGIVRVAGETAPVVVQCVEAVAHPPVRLARWPADGAFADRWGRLVFITDGLGVEAEADIRARLAALPADAVAARDLVAHPDLPTRCWLGVGLPILAPGSFETDGWVVMPRRWGTEGARAARAGRG